MTGKEIRVKTFFNHYEIVQHTVIENSHLDELTKRVLSLQEDGVRKALIELGWTPPPGENNAG